MLQGPTTTSQDPFFFHVNGHTLGPKYGTCMPQPSHKGKTCTYLQPPFYDSIYKKNHMYGICTMYVVRMLVTLQVMKKGP